MAFCGASAVQVPLRVDRRALRLEGLCEVALGVRSSDPCYVWALCIVLLAVAFFSELTSVRPVFPEDNAGQTSQIFLLPSTPLSASFSLLLPGVKFDAAICSSSPSSETGVFKCVPRGKVPVFFLLTGRLVGWTWSVWEEFASAERERRTCSQADSVACGLDRVFG